MYCEVVLLGQHAHEDGHGGVPGSAELRALAVVVADLVSLEPGVRDAVGEHVLLLPELLHPEVVHHVLGGHVQVDRRVDRYHQGVRPGRVLAVGVGERPGVLLRRHPDLHRALGHVLHLRQLVERECGQADQDQDRDDRPADLEPGGAAHLGRIRVLAAGPLPEPDRRVDQPAAHQHEDGDGHAQHRPVGAVDAVRVRRLRLVEGGRPGQRRLGEGECDQHSERGCGEEPAAAAMRSGHRRPDSTSGAAMVWL